MAKSSKLVNAINSSFELKCLDLLTRSYDLAIIENTISKDWEEESFSAHLVGHMRKLKHDFIINYEVPLVEKNVLNARKKVKNSNRIDVFFQKNRWAEIEYLEYHVEAKNISSSEWKKANGKKVNASQQQTDYIIKGIDRFLKGHYKDKNGCMLGYLVNGELNEVLVKISDKIIRKKEKQECINIGSLLINSQEIYESNHPERKLKHLFFNFTNN